MADAVREARLGVQFGATEHFMCRCGETHLFDGYVLAHWDIELSHTCSCGRGHTFKKGIVVALKPTPAKKKVSENA
ncbi:hypothetical protein [Salipiger sp. PrR003]|uniref:hypothetical protein n=1 Tax=Salipiger sp. PrR003 TaxID=2706776 RepID=UPI0013DD5F1D|nr:hypothetical protein [Salipiger sp. PrR003]NDV50405.1 hypothetical protein [Salipiger sp. PrR003]